MKLRRLLPWIALLSCAPALWAGGLLVPAAEQGRSPADLIVSAPAQRAVIFRPDDSSEVLLLQVAYRGLARPFCWIIPVPGEPGTQDVFTASQEFMDSVFQRTAPVLETEIIDPLAPYHPKGKPHPGGDLVLPRPYERSLGQRGLFSAGGYTVTILDARSRPSLAEWLQVRGYAVPGDLDAQIASYAERNWRFVALEGKPVAPADSAVMEYLRPVGIRFETKRPVYPLALAQAEAQPATLLELVVIAPVPVSCEQPASVDLGGRAVLKPGQAYERYRAGLRKDCLVREAVTRGACPYKDLGYDASSWTGSRKPQWNKFWSTRFAGVLPREKLVDLVFKGNETRPFRAHLQRSYEVRPQGLDLLRTGAGQTAAVMLLVLLVGTIAWMARQTAEFHLPPDLAWVEGESEETSLFRARQKVAVAGTLLTGPEAGFRGFVPRLVMYAGAIALAGPAWFGLTYRVDYLRGARLLLGGQMVWWQSLLWVLVLVAWSLLALRYVSRAPRGDGQQRTLVTLLTVLLSVVWLALVVFAPPASMREAAKLGAPGIVLLAQVAASLAIVAFSAIVAYLVAAGPWVSAVSRRLVAEFALLVAVVLLASPVVLGRPATRQAAVQAEKSRWEAYGQAVGELQDALSQFRQDQRAYPLSLSALTASEAPREGVDPAGNRLGLATQGPPVPYLASLPRDPLTGSATHWLYDPLSADLVWSDVFSTVVTTPVQDAAVAPKPTDYWRLPAPEALREALGKARDVLFGSPDSLVRVANGTVDLVEAVDLHGLRAGLCPLREVPGLDEPRFAVAPDRSSMMLSCAVRREIVAGSTMPRVKSAVFDVSSSGTRLTPLGAPVDGQVLALQTSGDGVRAGCILNTGYAGRDERSLWSLEPNGEWRGPLAENVQRFLWHPTEACMIALVARDDLPTGASRPVCDLVRVWPDGRNDPLDPGQRYSDAILVATGKDVLALTTGGGLHALSTDGEESRDLEVGGAPVLDALYLGEERVAVLLGPYQKSTGETSTGQLVLFNLAEGEQTSVSPVAPKGTLWTGGRILGNHAPTGYLFLRLWQRDPQAGRVVMVNQNGGPVQEISLATK